MKRGRPPKDRDIVLDRPPFVGRCRALLIPTLPGHERRTAPSTPRGSHPRRGTRDTRRGRAPAVLCVRADRPARSARSPRRGGCGERRRAYNMLNHIYYTLIPELRKYDFEVFLHGEKPRTQIINEFKKAKNPILFGTTSFWEGVDIQGENLSNVIIVKLPFLVPTDPIVAAISKKIEEEGKNSFSDFQLPEAIIKFKQGLGRLIRTKNDKGNIFILDNRILKKSYGSFFINSIPAKKSIKMLRKKEIIGLL